MSQLGHYVNRRNVQGAVFPGLALFFSVGETAGLYQSQRLVHVSSSLVQRGNVPGSLHKSN